MGSPPTRHRFARSREYDFAAFLRADCQARGVHLVQATEDEDRQFGIDDWLQLPGQGVVGVDWKTDHRAALTGNLAVEVIANAAIGRLGWVFTSQADYITYFLPASGRLLWFRTASLRASAIAWQSQYPTRGAHNDTRDRRYLYTTWNLLVPLAIAEAQADPNLPSAPMLLAPACSCPSCLSARTQPPPPAQTQVQPLAISGDDLI